MFIILFIPILVLPQANLNKQSSSHKNNTGNYFIENKGQIVDQNNNPNSNVAFLLNTPGLNVQLKSNGFSYDLFEREYTDIEKGDNWKERTLESLIDTIPLRKSKVKFHRIEFEFLNTNPNVKILQQNATSHTLNYYNVIHKPEGITGVRGFKKVVYENLYKNIDLEFIVPLDNNKPVEYNFVVKPYGKITDIKMQIKGAQVKYKESHLEIKTEFGILKEVIPLSWIEKDGQKKDINIHYQKLHNNVFGFACKSIFTADSTITIDPTPIREWGTYFGGYQADSTDNGGMTGDSNGNTIHVGITNSFDNIATVGSHQDEITGNNLNRNTGMLMKFDENGMLLWATYYGGLLTTFFKGVETDIENNIIAVGYTYSETNIATPGSHQEFRSEENDGFIVKFDELGLRLWASYYGGIGQDAIYSVTTDHLKNIFVGGGTNGPDNIVTSGAHDEIIEMRNNYYHSNEGFLVKFNEHGSREWGTYYGNKGEDVIQDIKVDSYGNVLIVGDTSSEEGISTTGAFKETLTLNGPQTQNKVDAFLAKFNTSGQRMWGTYFGGDAIDWGYGIAVDNENNVIISGATQSTIEIANNNAHQPNKGGDIADWDNFLAKFTETGSLLWSSYYGGEGREVYACSLVDTDSENNVYLAGGTDSQNNIATSNAYQEYRTSTHTNAYLTKFDKNGNILWGTYYGEDYTTAYGLYVSGESVYISGETKSLSRIASSGAHQSELNSNIHGNHKVDYFVVKFKECLATIITEVDESVCQGESIQFTASGGVSYQWTGPNNFVSPDSSPTIVNASNLNSGEYKVIIESPEGCTDERTFDITVSTVPIVGIIDNLIMCEDQGILGYSSMFDTSNIESIAINGQSNVIVSYYNSNGDALPYPLPNPMTNSIINQESIIVRVANIDNLDCYSETSFNLIVISNPIANSIEDFHLCDNNNNGFAVFDLSLVPSIVLGQQIDFDVELYNQDGAQILNPLNIYSNSIPNQEIITVRVTNDVTSCYNETTFTLNVNELPIANPLETLIGCDDNNDGISEYFNTTHIESQVLDSQTGMEISYFDSLGNILPNPLPNPFTNTEPNIQNITVRVTNSQTGCYSETIQTLETATQPNINQPDNLFACDEGNGFGSFDTSLLESELIGSQTGLIIYYTDDQGNDLSSPLPTTFQNTSAYNQTIFVRVENQLSSLCYSETSFELIINELPPIYLEPNYFICNLDPSIALSIDMSYNTYQWQFEDGNIISSTHEATIIEEGNYVLAVSRIENGITCENAFTFHLTRSILPSILDVKYDELGNNFIEIIASGDGGFEYSIDGINYQDSNYFGNIPGGIYNVYVRDKEGCGEDSTEVAIVDYPKFFTPNNDGYNDNWQIKGLNAQLRQSSKILIFDRYGKLLKQLDSFSKGWDGTYNGKDLPTNDYWFTVDLNDGRSFQGHFTLKR